MQVVAEISFHKIRQIGVGQGLNSKVYLAHDPQLNCQVAIKEIDKPTFWNPDYFAEAQAVYASTHPNVVPVHYGCEKGPSAFVAMPFYGSGSLADLLSHQPLDLSTALRIGNGILSGLAHIHIARYLHLDLKPSNILLSNAKKPLIADFGQARRISQNGIVSAPPMYSKALPPEVIQTGKAVVQSDIYQIGLLLYRCVNGETHFDDQLQNYPDPVQLGKAICKGKFPDRNNFLPHLPHKMRRIIRKAIAADPLKRFPSAAAFLDAWGRLKLNRNWTARIDPLGDCDWTGTADGKADLRVTLKSSSTTWTTEVHTTGCCVRAKGRANFWKVSETRTAAMEHLNSLFEKL